MEPREGGGHEHIHCHLQPVDLADAHASRFVLARYYFGTRPERPFRERLYCLRERRGDADFGDCVEMGIYRLRPQVEEQLRAAGGEAAGVAWDARDADKALRIPDCDVFWGWSGGRFEGRMRTESIVVHSPVLQKPLVVRDDVTLFKDGLWCNDRGNDLEGNYVYGNVNAVPYKMGRVEWAVHPGGDLR